MAIVPHYGAIITLLVVLINVSQITCSSDLAWHDRKDSGKFLPWPSDDFNQFDNEEANIPTTDNAQYDDSKDEIKPSEMHLSGVPKFSLEPKPISYTMTNKNALITCEAYPVSYASIECAGKSYPAMNGNNGAVPLSLSNVKRDSPKLRVSRYLQSGQPDPLYGKRWKFSLWISPEMVMEWFGTYRCHCVAWHEIPALKKAKMVKSTVGIVYDAYMENEFKLNPKDAAIEIGKSVTLECLPPSSRPEPNSYWTKNGEKIPVSRLSGPKDRFHLSNRFNFVIKKVVLSDSGNYTCVSELMNVKKTYSTFAQLTVYQNGGWSTWNNWTNNCPPMCHQMEFACSEKCKKSLIHRKRHCNNPIPLNGGQSCVGSNEETKKCDNLCFPDQKNDSHKNRPRKIYIYNDKIQESSNGQIIAIVCFSIIIMVSLLSFGLYIILRCCCSSGNRSMHKKLPTFVTSAHLLNPEFLQQLQSNNKQVTGDTNIVCGNKTGLLHETLSSNSNSTMITPSESNKYSLLSSQFNTIVDYSNPSSIFIPPPSSSTISHTYNNVPNCYSMSNTMLPMKLPPLYSVDQRLLQCQVNQQKMSPTLEYPINN